MWVSWDCVGAKEINYSVQSPLLFNAAYVHFMCSDASLAADCWVCNYYFGEYQIPQSCMVAYFHYLHINCHYLISACLMLRLVIQWISVVQLKSKLVTCSLVYPNLTLNLSVNIAHSYCRYTLSGYYTMLSWICTPAIGRGFCWGPSFCHPRSGMTRQVCV